MNKVKKVIYDCDNTMGLRNRDIDDGLTIMYLLNRDDVELVGITCTYANDSIDYVYNQTKELIKELELDIPVLKGNGNFEMIDYTNGVFENNTNSGNSEAAQFIVDKVNEFSDDIYLIATGSMQNLYDAYNLDNYIINKINQTVIMGGVTDKLFFGKEEMDELNLSVFPKGSDLVLKKFPNLTILTGNNCLPVEFTKSHFDNVVDLKNKKGIRNEFILAKISSWMDDFKRNYNYDSIVIWDAITAIYFTNPELFEDKFFKYIGNEEKLINGYLGLEILDDESRTINLPTAKDIDKINEIMIDAIFR